MLASLFLTRLGTKVVIQIFMFLMLGKNNLKKKARLLRPSYGYSFEYDTKFRMFSYGDGYYSITPVGLNPISTTLSLNYEGLSHSQSAGGELYDAVGFFEATKGRNLLFYHLNHFVNTIIFVAKA